MAYLQGDFRRDLEVTKLDTPEERWRTDPVNLIESLPGEPGNVPFATTQRNVRNLSPTTGKSNPRFSSGIGRLVPPNNRSTMPTILSEKWRAWRPPPPV